tara:strand:- start:1249 stop:1434 length:186 start_codon:yes stop_codon:yes gene_type:complete
MKQILEMPNKQIQLKEVFETLKQRVDYIDKELKKDENMDIKHLVLTTHDSFHKAIKQIYQA